jgi:alpha-amylase
MAFQVNLPVCPHYPKFSDDYSLQSRIVTDRFALPNGNIGACDAKMGRYCGGNWRGIINKLDYIQGMGFDAIWISPVSANIEGSFRWGEPYHVSHATPFKGEVNGNAKDRD